MANIIFSNRASSLLAASITNVATVIQVSAGEGALFPLPGAGEHFVVALVDDLGALEIVHCTSRAADLLTVVRAQEGTLAAAWTLTTTRVELRLTAGQMGSLVQKTGDIMTGNLDMDNNQIIDAKLTGATVITGGETVGTAIRGVLGQTSNQLLVPTSGRATVGGADILAVGDDLVQHLDTAGVIILPGLTGVKIEDGGYLRIQNSTDTDYVEFKHNGTDFIATGVLTTNFNFSGMGVDVESNLLVQGTVQFNGTLVSPVNTSAAEVGYRGAPVNTQNASYTLALADAGKMIHKASGAGGEIITIPANSVTPFPVGTMIAISNSGGGTLSIAINTDTLVWAETGGTGTRILSNNGIAVVTKVATTTWKIVGTVVT